MMADYGRHARKIWCGILAVVRDPGDDYIGRHRKGRWDDMTIVIDEAIVIIPRADQVIR